MVKDKPKRKRLLKIAMTAALAVLMPITSVKAEEKNPTPSPGSNYYNGSDIVSVLTYSHE